MKVNRSVLLNAIPATANLTGAAFEVLSAFGGSVQVIGTTGAAGTVQIQSSNDADTSTPTNWTNIAGAVVTVAGANTYLIDGLTMQYEWIRAVWTNSGSAGGTVTANAKLNGF